MATLDRSRGQTGSALPVLGDVDGQYFKCGVPSSYSDSKNRLVVRLHLEYNGKQSRMLGPRLASSEGVVPCLSSQYAVAWQRWLASVASPRSSYATAWAFWLGSWRWIVFYPVSGAGGRCDRIRLSAV